MRRTTALTVLAHGLALIALVGLVVEAAALVRSGSIAQWGLSDVLFRTVTLLVGWLLAARRPTVSLGWIMLGIALFGALQGPAEALGEALAGSLPVTASWLLWYGGGGQWAWVPEIGLLFTQLPLRFPDGRLPTPRWCWFSRVTIAVLVLTTAIAMTVGPTVGHGLRNPTFLSASVSEALAFPATVLLLGSFLGSVASLFVRYRRSGAVERAQLRWVFWALAVVVVLVVADWTESGLFGDDSTPGIAGRVASIGQLVTVAAYFLVPIAILVAVLRHGLYSIDRIISRTTAYAIVTLSVVLVYAVVVLLAGLVLPGAHAVGVALATLAAAAVFLPILRLVRRVVDRRFDRSRYDAQEVVERFGEHIRSGADPHAAGEDLIAAVQTALQPASVGIWVRERSAWPPDSIAAQEPAAPISS